MKWFFFLLIIGNLGLFIWLYPQQGGKSTAARVADVGELLLLEETGDQAGQGQQAAVVEETTPPNSAEPEERASASDTQADGAILAAYDETAAQSPPPAETERQTLQCGTIGLFEKRSQAELLSVQLRALGLEPEILSESRSDQAGYWVLVPPQPDRESALRIAKRLEAAGVADLWRFTSGPLVNAISLGLFRDLERARARKAKMARMGFDTEIRPRYREQSDYWIRYSFTGRSPFSEEKWKDFKAMYRKIKLKNEIVPCP